MQKKEKKYKHSKISHVFKAYGAKSAIHEFPQTVVAEDKGLSTAVHGDFYICQYDCVPIPTRQLSTLSPPTPTPNF